MVEITTEAHIRGRDVEVVKAAPFERMVFKFENGARLLISYGEKGLLIGGGALERLTIEPVTANGVAIYVEKRGEG